MDDEAAAPAGPPPSGLYRVLFPTVGAVVARLFRMRWLHGDRVPRSGGALLVANHVSYVDPFAMGLGLTRDRPIHYMGKIELFGVPVLAWFLRSMHAFPVRRGTADRNAIRHAAEILSSGGIVGLFPQGTRVRPGEESQAQVGAAFLASMANVPVVPVGISGTDRVWPPGRRLPRPARVTTSYGEPIPPERFGELPRNERLQAFTAEIMAGISSAKSEADGAGGEER